MWTCAGASRPLGDTPGRRKFGACGNARGRRDFVRWRLKCWRDCWRRQFGSIFRGGLIRISIVYFCSLFIRRSIINHGYSVFAVKKERNTMVLETLPFHWSSAFQRRFAFFSLTHFHIHHFDFTLKCQVATPHPLLRAVFLTCNIFTYNE